MKLSFLAILAVALLVPVTGGWADDPADAALAAQQRQAQVDVALATARLGLVQAQMKVRQGQFEAARQELAHVEQMLQSVSGQTDVSAYQNLLTRHRQELAKAESLAARAAATPPAATTPPSPQPAEMGEPADVGYGDPRLVNPNQPGLQGQVDLAIEQVKLAQDQAYTNPVGTRNELATDPALVKQRTIEHQGTWDMGRYAPARELIDVGKMLELDMERIHYQNALYVVRDQGRRDELMHVGEATVPVPQVMNYPDDFQQITEQRKQYADGVLWRSGTFTDTDGQQKYVAAYDVSDLLFVPIFPGPSEYNVRRPTNPLTFWTQNPRYMDLYLYGPFAGPRPGYGAGGFDSTGSYYGRGNYEIIPPYYYPFEADPIYQYRLAQRRAWLLQQVNQMLATQPKPAAPAP